MIHKIYNVFMYKLEITKRIIINRILFLGKNCVTTGGSAPEGTMCMFPFEYNGEKYNTCITADHTQLWCITDTEGNWGNCKETCGRFKTI